jgi:Protein of unknown function (DUF2958)
MASFFNPKGNTMSHTDIARPDSPAPPDSPSIPAQPCSDTATQSDLTSLAPLTPFLCVSQLAALSEGLGGEERIYFVGLITQLNQTLATMPVTYEQGPLGDEAVVHLHYFLNDCDWWITELDLEDQVSQAFGLVQLNGYEPELGYISITELVSLGVELDVHWHKQTLSQVRLRLDGALDCVNFK